MSTKQSEYHLSRLFASKPATTNDGVTMSLHKAQRPQRSEPEDVAESTSLRKEPASAIPVPTRSTRSPSSFFSRHRQGQHAETQQTFKTERQDQKAAGVSRPLTGGSKEMSSIKTPAEAHNRPRNVLRRKPPTVSQRTPPTSGRIRSDTSESKLKLLPDTPAATSLPGGYRDPYPDTVLGIALPTLATTSKSAVPELASLASQAPHKNLPTTTAISTTASTPSTRYSDSPGPWSRTSTPTSLSSYSPGITQASNFISRTKLPSPADRRPPVTWRKGHDAGLGAVGEPKQGLPILRESLTSSSSGSTVKAPEVAEKPPTARKEKKILNAPSPSPPPRKSSMKFKSRKTTPGTKRETSASRPQAPPELAHLRTALPPESRHEIPPRPSREGTEDLDVQPSPVIHSNMSPLKISGHRRRESFESPVIQSIPPPSESTAKMARGHQRNPTPSPLDLASPVAAHVRDTSAAPATHGRIGSRFGFFSKRSRSTPDPSDEQQSKPLRKGPAAGTGHEGYGKYAQRGRRPSIGPISSRAHSTSTSASGSQTITSYTSSTADKDNSRLDEFLRERLNPVPISGGGGLSLVRTDSYPSSVSSQPSVSSASYSTAPSQNRDMEYDIRSSNLLSSSAKLQGATKTLADRRSLRRSQLLDEKEITRRPAPINTQLLGSPPSLNSYETSQSSLLQTDTTLPPGEDVLTKVDSRGSTKADKPGRKLKWTFFQRAQKPDKKAQLPEPEAVTVTEMPATISRIPALRPVAHYAIMDSEAEQSDNLEDILQSIEDSPSGDGGFELGDAVPFTLRRQHGQSVLLPSPPSLGQFSEAGRPESPKVQLYRDVDSPLQSPIFQEIQEAPLVSPTRLAVKPRPSRLAPVGRIPRVVSKRDREHRPPETSFSRPFTRIRPQVHETMEETSLSAGKMESNMLEAEESNRLTTRTDIHPLADSAATYSVADVRRVPDPFANERAFLTFPSQHDSEVSGSTSSGALTSAALPIMVGAPLHNPEDEVWNEYDDLIDDVLFPTTPKTAVSTASSLGLPFRYMTGKDVQRPTQDDQNDDITQEPRLVSNSSPSTLR